MNGFVHTREQEYQANPVNQHGERQPPAAHGRRNQYAGTDKEQYVQPELSQTLRVAPRFEGGQSLSVDYRLPIVFRLARVIGKKVGLAGG